MEVGVRFERVVRFVCGGGGGGLEVGNTIAMVHIPI